MERVKDARKFQGGGSGEGFKEPEQMQNESVDYRSKIQEDILLHSGFSSFREDMFETSGNNDKEIWTNQLNLRLKHLSGPLEETPATLSTIQPTVQSRFLDSTKTVPMRQYIPGLPNTIEDLICLWRKGSPTLGFRPVYIYNSAESRKLLIPGYKNATWVSSGQKRAYQRLKAFAQAVSKLNDSISDIFGEGSDSAWQTALDAFNEKFSLKESKKKLSSLESIIKKD